MLTIKDQRIIEALRQDGRQKLSTLAKNTGLPLSTAHERLQKLLRKKLIRIASIPDYERLHMPLTCWCFINAKDRETTLEHLKQAVYTNTLLSINNGADIAAELIFPTLKTQHEFIQELQTQGTIRTYPVIDVLGKEQAKIIRKKMSFDLE